MNGRQHGLGVLRRPDGSVAYEGEWRNGKYHGLGVERFGNDVRYAGQSWNESINNAGQWEDGWLRGLGVARYPNGHVWHAGSWPRELPCTGVPSGPFGSTGWNRSEQSETAPP
eukprot:GHVU01168478.1.p2 GENE.GHVU01168478.1~~GHVU01168478.1.p2  ORF type:complete len:113 (-),score=1.30 GHVU01168478.1:60-398(-)